VRCESSRRQLCRFARPAGDGATATASGRSLRLDSTWPTLLLWASPNEGLAHPAPVVERSQWIRPESGSRRCARLDGERTGQRAARPYRWAPWPWPWAHMQRATRENRYAAVREMAWQRSAQALRKSGPPSSESLSGPCWSAHDPAHRGLSRLVLLDPGPCLTPLVAAHTLCRDGFVCVNANAVSSGLCVGMPSISNRDVSICRDRKPSASRRIPPCFGGCGGLEPDLDGTCGHVSRFACELGTLATHHLRDRGCRRHHGLLWPRVARRERCLGRGALAQPPTAGTASV